MTDNTRLFKHKEYQECLKTSQSIKPEQSMLHAKAERGVCEVFMAGAALGLLQILIRAAERLGDTTGQTFTEVLDAMEALYTMMDDDNKETYDYDRS